MSTKSKEQRTARRLQKQYDELGLDSSYQTILRLVRLRGEDGAHAQLREWLMAAEADARARGPA